MSAQLTTKESIPGSIMSRTDLSVTAKRLFARLKFEQSHHESVEINNGLLAVILDVSGKTISRAVKRLEKVGLITVIRRTKCTNFYSVKQVRDKKFFCIYNNVDSRLSVSSKMIISYLKFRQGKNNAAFPFKKTIAKDLGMDKTHIGRLLDGLEAAGFVQVKHAHGGLKQKNRYAVTNKAFEVPKCDTRTKSGVALCPTVNNTSKEVKENTTRISFSEGLQNKKRLLIRQLIAYPVANSLSESHSTEEIQAAIANAICQERKARAESRAFNRAGYIVGSLNAARRTNQTLKYNGYAVNLLKSKGVIMAIKPVKIEAEKKRQIEEVLRIERTETNAKKDGFEYTEENLQEINARLLAKRQIA